jgi:hypothetical protein
LFSEEEIQRRQNSNERSRVTQKAVQNELSNHRHPKTRIMPDNTQRTLPQSKDELLQHYRHQHPVTYKRRNDQSGDQDDVYPKN